MDNEFENWLRDRPPEQDGDDGRLPAATVVGAYRIEAFRGKGGFAEVYRAKASDGTCVAVKMLHRLDEQSRLRFERETSILVQVQHPNIPKLLSCGVCGDRPYLVTELLQARELPHTDRDVAVLIGAVCAAAEALHEKGYVHRDIKPSNILWRGDTPVLIDFGLACPKSEEHRPPSTLSIVDGQRVVVGTAGYAAPEQFAGGKIDETTDVHAIGALANACFDERPPRAWVRIIRRAANTIVAQRYKSARVLAAAVRHRHRARNALICSLSVCSLVFLAAMAFVVLRNARFDQSLEKAGRVAPPDRSFSINRYSESELFATSDIGITGWVMGEKIDPLSEDGLDETAFHSIVTIIRQQFDGDFESYVYNQTNLLASQKARITYAREEIPGSVFAVEIENFIEGRGKFHIYRKAYRCGNLIYLVVGADLMHLWPKHGRELKACVDSFKCQCGSCKKTDRARQ